MAITLSSFSPSGGANVDENIVFRIVDNSFSINLSSIEVSLGSTLGAFSDHTAVLNGAAINGYTRIIHNNNPGPNNDYTISVSFSPILPTWTPGDKITVAIVVANSNADGYLFVQEFFTSPYGLVHPPDPTETIFLCSLPTGWNTFSSGSGSIPTFGSDTIGCKMTTHPGNGTSYIYQTDLDIDYVNGFLFDFVFRTSITSPFGVTKIAEVQKGGFGLFSISYDNSTQELYLNDVPVVLPTGFRPGLMKLYTMRVFVRLTVHGPDKDHLTARLYAGLNPSFKSPLLQQTTSNSTTIGTNENVIKLGVLDNPNNINLPSLEFGEVIVGTSSIGNCIMNGVDPDIFYASTHIKDISKVSGEVNGGETIRLTFHNRINALFGVDQLSTTDFNTSSENNANLRPECSGSGTASIIDGDISLVLGPSGSGVAAVRFLDSYSGNDPSAADISIDLIADQNLVHKPVAQNVIVAALQFFANNQTTTLQLVSDTKLKTYWNLVITNNGTTIVNKFLFNTAQVNNTIRIVHFNTNLIMFINNTKVVDGTTGYGPGLLKLYSQCSTNNINCTSTFNNFNVRPVIKIGDKIALDGFFQD